MFEQLSHIHESGVPEIIRKKYVQCSTNFSITKPSSIGQANSIVISLLAVGYNQSARDLLRSYVYHIDAKDASDLWEEQINSLYILLFMCHQSGNREECESVIKILDALDENGTDCDWSYEYAVDEFQYYQDELVIDKSIVDELKLTWTEIYDGVCGNVLRLCMCLGLGMRCETVKHNSFKPTLFTAIENEFQDLREHLSCR